MGRWKGEVFESRKCDSNPPRWLMGTVVWGRGRVGAGQRLRGRK